MGLNDTGMPPAGAMQGLGMADVNGERMRGVPLGGWSAAGNEKVRKLFIEYQGGNRTNGSQRTATIECEWYHEMYGQGFSVVHLACPLCMKGHHDIPVDAEGDPSARSLVLRQEKKGFSVDDEGRITVDEPVTCTYCGTWTVKITRGVANDCAG